MLLLSVVSKTELCSVFDTTLKTVGAPKAQKNAKRDMDFMVIKHYVTKYGCFDLSYYMTWAAKNTTGLEVTSRPIYVSTYCA
ncbi:hypothetical protein KDA_38670 [Dictyobacter alpinus]|uniref:Uncharacterized protein n=1 Tax=Dictyobacter alpinus TaxID=2014873 RepID=A0A402BAG4_9CHLR|nr:hypothetical protein KDA_38670 [Dictyobacter alpinus]